MRHEAAGEVRFSGGVATTRVRAFGKRETFRMPTCKTENEASNRSKLLARIAKRMAKANVDPAVGMKTLEEIAAASPRGLTNAVALANELVGGLLEAVPEVPTCPTLRELGKRWIAGELHQSYPDQVKLKKDTRNDEQRLDKLCEIEVSPGQRLGDIPLNVFTTDHAEEAMRNLPPSAKEPATRRQYGQLISRVLGLAVYPCRIIETSPLPRGFLPKAGKPPARAYLYPTEEAILMAAEGVWIGRRLLWGFLAREGAREGESIGANLGDFDLERGVFNLGENKTDDPRTWVLGDDVARALRWWVKHYRPRAEATDAMFVDEHGRRFCAESTKFARVLRGDLQAAGVARPALFAKGKNRAPFRVHDLRGSFVTLALAGNRRTETWVADRTGHRSSQMINRYRRAARTAAELGLGWFRPLDFVIPEMSPMPGIVEALSAISAPSNRSALAATPSYCPRIAPEIVGHEGLEPSANGLRIRCSTN